MSKKILIVDDEVNMRTLLQETLEEFEEKGVALLVVENGSDAIKSVRAEKPDLLILDAMMPGTDGFDVCNTIKNKLGMKGVYILILSADGQDVNKQKSRNVGADGFMTKPFDPDEIAEKVTQVLKVEI